MIEHLKNLVFGLEGYEKVKIDSRFDEIITILPDINIKQLSDFETIEKCIYKLKEHLRIKSSNLNRLIKDSSSTLTKKKVDKIIETLENLRFKFIQNAFTIIEKSSNNFTEDISNSDFLKDDSKTKPNKENDKKSNDFDEKRLNEKIKENLNEKTKGDNEENKNSIKIYSDSELIIYLNNGKVPYMLVDFIEEINLPLLKYLSSLVFEEIKPQGTNVIIENKKALIIPRNMEDNLINLPRIQSNINEDFEKIISKSKEKKETSTKKKEIEEEPKEKLKKEIREEIKEKEEGKKEEDEYIEIDKKEGAIKTRKKEEDSLDSLLGNIEDKKVSHTPKPNPSEDKSQFQFEVEKEVEIEKKEKQQEQNREKEINIIHSNSYEIYRDEQIVAYLNEKSSVLGEIIVKNLANKKNSQLNESELSYVSIFSKIFASVLFEIVQAQGTNIIWSFNEDYFRIVPRYQNDNLKINWNPKQSSDDFLEQIRNKLLEEMTKEVEEINKDRSDNINEKEISKNNQNNSRDVNTNSNENANEKAKYILESLKRLP